jgi:hypothetical protein
MNFTKSFQGISPRVINTTQQGNSNVAPLNEASQIPLDRKLIRKMFPANSQFEGTPLFSKRWPQTPFRVAMHAGDLLLRQNEPGGSNQIKGSVGIGRYKYTVGSSADGVRKGNGASGNQHYVYDSSVYTKYKRLQQKQKNYNDYTFAGNANNGSYVAIRGIRRF